MHSGIIIVLLKKKKISILKMFFIRFKTWNSLNTTILKLNLFSSNRLFNDLTLRATSLKGNHEYKTHSLWVSLYIYMNGFQIRILTVIRPLEKRSKYYSIFPHTNIEFIVTSIRKKSAVLDNPLTFWILEPSIFEICHQQYQMLDF